MSIGIYSITNMINGSRYIGQSIHIERRWNREKSSAFNINDKEYNYPRSRALRKYGIDNFNFEILELCSKEQLNEREEYWIKHYNSQISGYNLTSGGDNAIITRKLSVEEIDQIIELLLENKLSEQVIAAQYCVSVGTISEINRGHVWAQDGLSYPLRRRINLAKKYLCPCCGKEIHHSSKMCLSCYKQTKHNITYHI